MDFKKIYKIITLIVCSPVFILFAISLFFAFILGYLTTKILNTINIDNNIFEITKD